MRQNWEWPEIEPTLTQNKKKSKLRLSFNYDELKLLNWECVEEELGLPMLWIPTIACRAIWKHLRQSRNIWPFLSQFLTFSTHFKNHNCKDYISSVFWTNFGQIDACCSACLFVAASFFIFMPYFGAHWPFWIWIDPIKLPSYKSSRN